MGQRWYDPATGRWLSRDPIGFSGGLNHYQYAKSNPINSIDFSGLSGVEVVEGAAQAVWGISQLVASGAAEVDTVGLSTPVAAPVAASGLRNVLSGLFKVGVGLGLGKVASDLSSSGKEDECSRKPFAIGFMKYLYGFAAIHGAETWRDYAPVPWKVTVSVKIYDPTTEIYVNMQDLDAKATFRRATDGSRLTATDEEMMMINATYPIRKGNTYFYNGTNPFQPGYNER